MDVKLVSVKCPECGATLDIEEDRRQAFCTYCGAKVILQNENEHIYRHIDEAEVKQAETERIIRLKKMEFAEKRLSDYRRMRSLKIKVALISGILGILAIPIGMVAGEATGDPNSSLYMISASGYFFLFFALVVALTLTNNDEDDIMDLSEKAKVPSSIRDYEKLSYIAVEAMLKGAGFTNVESIPLNDLTTGLIKKPGSVDSIVINNKKITNGGDRFSKDARVVISYHSLNR